MYQCNNRLKLLALMLALMLAPWDMPALAAKSTKTQTVAAQPSASDTHTTTRKAYLYKSAKSSSKKLMLVPSGTSVSVLKAKNGWAQVNVDGTNGYMKTSAFKAQKVSAPPKPTQTPVPTQTPKPTPTPKPTASPKASAKGLDMIVTSEDARVYAKTSTSSKSVSVEKGTVVRVLKQQSKWSKIKRGSGTAYMLSASFSQILTEKANIYAKPDASSKSVTLKSGTTVLLLERDGDWSRVRKSGTNGYIKTALLKDPEPTPSATPKPTATPSPTPTPSAAVSETTKRDAYLYQKPSTSAKRVTLKAGTSVTVLDSNDKWVKVRVKNKLGYLQRKAFTEPDSATQATPVPGQPSPAPTSQYQTLRSGKSGEAVLKLQKRLEDLGYMDSVPNGKYSASTATSVKAFQSNEKLSKTGVADSQTQALLYSAGATPSAIHSASLKKGSVGTKVKRLQLRLRAKGFFKGKVNGKYNEATEQAVKLYQQQAGLSVDGVAGKGTLQSLFSSRAPAYVAVSATPTPTPTVEPTPTPKPTAAPTPKPTSSAPSSAKKQKADKVIDAAMSKLGKPYVFGSTGPNSYDCSGFTMYAYSVIGISLPHSAFQQGYECGAKVDYEQLQRGDLVCWNTVSDSDLSDHVGIYLGNGQAIHASSGSGKVVISSITSGYYNRVFSWGRALF